MQNSQRQISLCYDFAPAVLRDFFVRYLYFFLATAIFVIFNNSALAGQRASCGKSTICSQENVRHPFMLRSQPLPSGAQLGRLPVMLNTFQSEHIVEVTFTPETLIPLLLLTERWLQQHTEVPLLQSPQVHNQHYPGLKLHHNSEKQRNDLSAWGATEPFNEALTAQLQQQATDTLLLLFIGRNTLLPQGSIPPYLTHSSWQGRGEQAKLGTEFFEFLAYQAVLINRRGEVIAAATEGFQIGTSIYTDPLIFLTVGPDKYLRSWYQLNQRDIRQSIALCAQDAACPAYQALAQLLSNLQLTFTGAH